MICSVFWSCICASLGFLWSWIVVWSFLVFFEFWSFFGAVLEFCEPELSCLGRWADPRGSFDFGLLSLYFCPELGGPSGAAEVVTGLGLTLDPIEIEIDPWAPKSIPFGPPIHSPGGVIGPCEFQHWRSSKPTRRITGSVSRSGKRRPLRPGTSWSSALHMHLCLRAAMPSTW